MLGGLITCELPQGEELELEKGQTIPSFQEQAMWTSGQGGHGQGLNLEEWEGLESGQMLVQRNQLEPGS